MKIVICGLAITSSWGNGHATTYRALTRALRARGHRIVFFERDVEWYSSNRDMPEPPFCRVELYKDWDLAKLLLRRELQDADVAVVGSYFPDGIAATEEVLGSRVPVKAFYDIDTPITVAQLRTGDAEYIRRDQIPGFDVYLSFTGGPMLKELETTFGAGRAVPLYCSFDPDRYRVSEPEERFRCELSYMGTFAADRQQKLTELLLRPAEQLSARQFMVAGPQYPGNTRWPKNVRHIMHLEPKFHAPFYSSSRFSLNLTRRDMVEAGYSPSVRLFEAAGCGAAIISDSWPGLETFLVPSQEILLADSTSDVVHILKDLDAAQSREIGKRAQERVLAQHSAANRAIQFEEIVGAKKLQHQYV